MASRIRFAARWVLTRRQFIPAALVLLSAVGWTPQVSAADPDGGGSPATPWVGAGPIRVLAIDPETQTTLYAVTGCSGVLKSLDGGASWSPAHRGLPNLGIEVFALAVDPANPTTLYAAGNAGVFESLNGGGIWGAVNDGLPGGAILALAIDPATRAILYAGTFGGGVFQSLDGGGSWSAANSGLTNQWIAALAIDPATPTTVYAGTEDGVFKSLNRGGSWSAANTGLTGQLVLALAIDSGTPSRLYAGTNGNGVFQSLNGGSSWEATTLTNLYVQALAIDPAAPDTLYAATSHGGYGGGVFRSTDGGSSWEATGLADRFVGALAIDPTTPAMLYAGGFAGLFRSLDGGRTWQATGLGGVVCGDGVIACGGYEEQCDDGNAVNGDGCDASCRREFCGDAIVQAGLGEECDDGNLDPFDGCPQDCIACGNGVVTPPEECDGGTASGDRCDAKCRRPHVVGTGTSQSCTESAFTAALAEGSVVFDCGPDPVVITLTSEKVISAATIIDGGGLVTLSGGGAVRMLAVEPAAVLALRDLTIADGYAPGDGGGIRNDGTLAVSNCTFSGNDSGGPGGAISNSGTLTVANSNFFSNSSGVIDWFGGVISGGAIYNSRADYRRPATVTLANSAFSSNSGGAISQAVFDSQYAQTTVSLTDSTFSSNGGGVIRNLGGTLAMTNCTVSGNQGFALRNTFFWCGRDCGGTALLTNCTLRENGGAIASEWIETGSLYDCRWTSCAYPWSVALINTIVVESAGPSCDFPIADGGHNLQFPDTSCGSTIPSVDPRLDPAGLQDNGGPTQTVALLSDSPAINAGDPEVCANPPVNGVDQRGHARPGAGSLNCSIGAFESDYPAPPCTGDCDNDGRVSINELILGVNIVLALQPADACPEFAISQGVVDIAQLITGVNNALDECGPG